MNLFKFMSKNTFIEYLNLHLDGKTYVTDWQSVNDPMEGFFRYKLSDDDYANLVVGQKTTYKLSCFTKTFNNYLMWSHYADKHQGVCLEYDVNPASLDQRYILECVTYSNQLPQMDTALPMEEQAKIFLLTKTYHWRYEKEVRLLFQSPRNDTIPFCKLKSITFGIRFDDEPSTNDIITDISTMPDKPKMYKAMINYDKAVINRTRI